ncbi:hypothetical protein EDD21DRAFT_145049 [Dissophora ornata]|nr:hypothetical protein BGZ58_008378 [Dissophora ornata]KAI8600018.1 hypothetical protein EDD21DRAFT_145049 [Dissophora ornata]
MPMEDHNDNLFPLINKQAARTIQGRHTEVLVTSFADKILIVISQYGKVGSLIHTSVDQQSLTSSIMASSDLATTTSSFLLGAGSTVSKKTQLYQVYASHISQMIHHQNPAETRPVVLSLALSIQEPDAEQSPTAAQEQDQRRQDRDLFENVIELVNECSVWE